MLNIELEGKQREVMALPDRGHIVVLGTAGSGKTTVALFRAYHLASIPNSGKVLLVTFNGALVEYMRGMISGSSPRNLVVENYHKFARGYLNFKGKMPHKNGILDPNKKASYIEQAVNTIKKLHTTESTFGRSIQFFVDEITFIQQFGFTGFEDYYNAERIGRSSANIKRENRKWIFEVYEEYIELRKEDGYRYDWDDLAFYAYSELQKDNTSRLYTHIIVDEGQDFSPMMIRSLVAAVANGGSFTFFGDVAQQIYGGRLSWRDSDINTNKIWKFDTNYRNPPTIIDFAKDITKSDYWSQDNDIIEANNHIAEGPKPVLVKFSNKCSEIDWVVEKVITLGETSSTVIICRNRSDIDAFLKILKSKGCHDATEINKKTPPVYDHTKTIYLATFHASKGLEFDNVFVPFLTYDKLPDNNTLSNAVSKKEVYANEIKLLYVAVTRSKYGLYMTFSGELSPLFPKDSKNYDFHDKMDVV